MSNEKSTAASKDEQRELAYELYSQGYKYADIADQVGVSLSAVKSWATRYWKNKKVADKKLQPKEEKVAKVATKKKYKKGMNPNSRNGTGPPGNQNARKHGFYSKVFPEEAYELFNDIESLDPIEILWGSIKAQFLAIMRAQHIMYVEDIGDETKDITVQGADSTVYQIQHAWDKQANFLQAQSRAIQTLNNSIKQYDDLMRSELATEEQKARIEVLKAKVNDIKNKELEYQYSKGDSGRVTIVNDVPKSTNKG